MNSLSLYAIEESLQMLVDERERAEAEGDLEAVKAIDAALTEYLTREAAKIDSYAGLIHQLKADDEACAREMSRIRERRERAIALRRRLEANAIATMQAHGVKELKTYRNTLRRRGNGGLQALEIEQLGAVPMEYRTVTVKLRRDRWLDLIRQIEVDAVSWLTMENEEPDTQSIREALKTRVVCPECTVERSLPKHLQVLGYGENCKDCPRCEGTGTIPNTVPGVKLLERGEHLVVS